MHKFKRQTSDGGAPNADIDFGAAATKIPRTVEPGDYRLRVESARIIGKNHNILIVLDLVDTESGFRVETRPLWVDGPNSDAGNLAAENQHVIAQLLTLKKLPTSGPVGDLIPKLVGLEFDAGLVLSVDSRSGRSFNSIADIYKEAAV
jgi:hypothetical protein